MVRIVTCVTCFGIVAVMVDAANATAPGAVVRRARMAMGTLVEIEASTSNPSLLDEAFAALSGIEAAFSFFRPTSLLARINRARVGDEIDLLPWQDELLREVVAVERASGGCFNANLGEQLIELGLRPRLFETDDVPRGTAGEALEWFDAGHIRIRRRVCLDLGGFAKGAGVDAALARLAQAGVRHACVNAGGDLAVLGERSVALRAVGAWQRAGASLALCDEALASSVRYAMPGPFNGQAGLAVLGRDGRHLSLKAGGVAVRAPRCAIADALTKVVLVSGDLGHPLLAANCAAAIELE